MTNLEPLGRFAWERVVKRCALPRSTKFVALALATFASGNGSEVRPGEAQLAADLGMSTRTVRRHLKRLRDDYALIERTQRGGSRLRFADTYRLVMPDDLDARVGFTDDPELRTSRAGTPDISGPNSGQKLVRPPQRPPTDHNTGTGDCPPEVEDSLERAVEERSEDPDRLSDARKLLGTLDDLGEHWLRRARDDLPDTASLAELMIRAAEIARRETAA